MPNTNEKPQNVYPNKVDWDAFDDEERELIDYGVDLLSDFAARRKNRPHVSEIKQMFLDDFDGFEDATAAHAAAIAEKLQDIWDKAHGQDGADHQWASCADEVDRLLVPIVPDELKEKAYAAARALDPYVGRTDEGSYAKLDWVDEDEMREVEWALNDVESEVVGYRFAYEMGLGAGGGDDFDGDLQWFVDGALVKYKSAYKSLNLGKEDWERLFERMHDDDVPGIGTPVHSARVACRLAFEARGVQEWSFDTIALSNAQAGEGMCVSVSWMEDGHLHTSMAYGYCRLVGDKK